MKFKLMCCLLLAVCALSGGTAASGQVESKSLNVGFDRELPPFSYLDSQGLPAGFSVEFISLMAAQSGWKLNLIPMNAADFSGELKQGTIDVALGMKYSSISELQSDFSEPFFTESEVLVVPKEDNSIYSLTHLNGKIVAVQKGSVSMDALENIRNVKLNITSSQLKAFELLKRGRADAFVGDSAVVRQLLAVRDNSGFEVRIRAIQPGEYAFAVRKGNYELIGQLNDSIQALLRSGEYDLLYKKWFEQGPNQAWWRGFALLLLAVAAAAAVLSGITHAINKRLKREVGRHTKLLKNHLAFQRQVLNTIDNGILSVDSGGLVKLANLRALEMFNLKGDPTGRPVREMKQLEQILTLIGLDSVTGEQEGEFALASELNAEGLPTKHVQYYAAVLHNSIGERDGWTISFRDRTREKTLQEKLLIQEKLRSLGQMAAGIAHELRNPLTSVKMFIDLLPVKYEDSRYRSELLKHVPAEFQRMNQVVEELLDYTRKKAVVKERINLHEFLVSILSPFEIQYAAKEIQIIYEVEPHTELIIDRQRMKQVFINLIANAADAVQTSAVKIIAIRATEADEEIRIDISDSGCGIEESDLPHLFQPFFTTKRQGVGLGLHICQHIMIEHDGSIEVRSFLNEGSTFTLKLPKERL